MTAAQARTIATLMTVYAATFFLGAALHAGAHIPLGFTTLHEPHILPATVVESACGLALLGGALGLLAHRPWRRAAAIAAHLFSLAGVGLGLLAGAAGTGDTTLNATYHRVMVVALLIGLGLLLFWARPTPAHRPPARSVQPES